MPDGDLHCSFVMSKTRVAPLKMMSIVRLELQAAVLAVRLAEAIKKEVTCRIDETVYWSDSKVVLGYIMNGSRRFHVFVAVRISEIHDSTTPYQWRHVPGCENPADDCSRGVSAAKLSPDCRWLTGPSFLWNSVESWPEDIPTEEFVSTDDPEVKKNVCLISVRRAVLPDPSKKSSWVEYIRITAWMLRFINNFVSTHRKVKLEVRRDGPLSVAEFKRAETLILSTAQRQKFPMEYAALRSAKRLPSSSKLLQLDQELDASGLMRARGRLMNANIPTAARFPVILPNAHDVTRMVIMHTHIVCLHAGIDHTLNQIRQRYCILKSRSTVRKLLFHCPNCKKRRVQPKVPKMADLPEARFDDSHPFNSVGIDYFGPYEVHRFRKTEKRYGLLVTCMSTRAIHLEMSNSLDTDSFLMAFRRFVARRGRPAVVYSDNGTNLKSGENELRQALRKFNHQHIEDDMSQKMIQ
ncbi:uncharacterized protein LOC141909157 [Tubulanus polymorphus]|uniref:uncharacterized protein LOC141909157 n=1 Tax=Tubulanus polymorphus TaxID=672921 RepID=UPI003DA1FE37